MRIKNFNVVIITAILFTLLSVGIASAKATTDTTNILDTIDATFYVPCAADGEGEWVHFTGKFHVIFHTTEDGNGGFLTTAHFQPQGVTGVGLTTGDTYHGTGLTRDQFHTKAGVQYTFISNFRLIGEGTGNNLLVHETFHVTVNANGELTAEVLNFSEDCK